MRKTVRPRGMEVTGQCDEQVRNAYQTHLVIVIKSKSEL